MQYYLVLAIKDDTIDMAAAEDIIRDSADPDQRFPSIF